MNDIKQEGWEKRFDEAFVSLSDAVQKRGFLHTKQDIKAFIEAELRQAREKTLREVLSLTEEWEIEKGEYITGIHPDKVQDLLLSPQPDSSKQVK